MEKIETLKQFYDFMLRTKLVKQQIFDLMISADGQALRHPDGTDKLTMFVSVLKNIKKSRIAGKYSLVVSGGKAIDLDLSYEIGELEKDIFFLAHGEDAFFDYMESWHKGFSRSVDDSVAVFKGMRFNTFITDRDGTVNNYCGRYISSIQSIYNALFLYRYSAVVGNAVLLTSAPLQNTGMADISLIPKTAFVYAGSKGREYFDRQGVGHRLAIPEHKQRKLDELNERLAELLKDPEYECFSLIGSGLQFKFGQTTVARQDISDSIEPERSAAFLNTVRAIVKDIDPEEIFFRIEDTRKDIEIILTAEDGKGAGELKDFDKGDGVEFLDTSLGLGLAAGPNLICGDTGSDVAMARAAAVKSEKTWALFVTEDLALKEKVKEVCPNSFFVRNPDILVMSLNRLSKILRP